MIQPNNYNRRYNEKTNKNKKLTEILRQEKHIKKRITIHVIITTDDFIDQFSLKKLQKLNIKIDWEQIIRKMIIDQMKDLMYDIHQELQVVDLGTEQPSIQLIFETTQYDLIDDAREISIILN